MYLLNCVHVESICNLNRALGAFHMRRYVRRDGVIKLRVEYMRNTYS